MSVHFTCLMYFLMAKWLLNICEYYDWEKLSLISVVIMTSFIGQFVHPVGGERRGSGKEG